MHSYYTYIDTHGTDLYTVVLLPDETGTFPAILFRNPYVDHFEDKDDSDVLAAYVAEYAHWVARGYALIYQHCRGRGKSGGDCIPYIHERADGLRLLDWVREQAFYNGELYLCGGSYTSSVHYTTAPFGDDVKGASFCVQDTERYNICYRNGCFKKALHGNWYVGMYKSKTCKEKPFDASSFDMLPLSHFTRRVLGETVADFDAMLQSPHPNDPFWQTHNGGSDARGATDNVRFPILFTTGFYDIYTGGIFDMWHAMSEDSRRRSALVVSPYNHGDGYDSECSIGFPNGQRTEQFGENYELDWFDYIRGVRATSPFETGKVTYYRLFENRWETDDFALPDKAMVLRLGEEAVTYTYDPNDAPRFRGGLSCNFGGALFQDPPHQRRDIISVYTTPFENDMFVKGKMSATLRVRSDCEDTGFYVRISLEKPEGDYGLRDDITSLVFQRGDYTPNADVTLNFAFDEHAFLIRKGERLRIDIASANNEHYVRHTNTKGLYSEQTATMIAHNTVDLAQSYLRLPIE